MKKVSKQKILKVISYFMTFIIVVGLLGGASYFVKNMQSSYSSFTVANNEEVYSGINEDIVFAFNTELSFVVDYEYHKLAMTKEYGYTVKVVPVAENDFNFTVGGNEFSYLDEIDITSAFNLVIVDDTFSIIVPGSIVDVLAVIYGDNDIVVPTLDADKDYYKLVITSFDGLSEISISFKQYSLVTGVMLDNETLVIGGKPTSNNQPLNENTNNTGGSTDTDGGGSTNTNTDETTEPGGGFSGGGGGAR